MGVSIAELHDSMAEQGVLASILCMPNCLLEVISFLEPDHFFIQRNGWIYEAMLALYRRGEGIDALTLRGELLARGKLEIIGGMVYLSEIIDDRSRYYNVEVYARQVEALAVRRRLHSAGSELATLAHDGSMELDEILDSVEIAYREATTRSADRYIIGGDTLADQAFAEWTDWLDNPADIRGLSTGIHGLDTRLGGLMPGVYAIGGATSMGKSTLTAFLVRSLAAQAPGILIPTETPGRVVYHKMASDMAGIPYKQLRSGKAPDWAIDKVNKAYNDLHTLGRNIKLMDTSHPTLPAIHAESLRMSGCQWVVIDSGSKLANAIRHGEERLLDSVNRTSSFAQDLARLGLVVIVTWQFGRNSKPRESKVPRINDFKESGAIEEDADVCLGIYRHDYYVKRGEAQPDKAYPPNTARLLILKDRNGGDGDDAITLYFKAGKGFYEMTDDYDGRP